MTVNSTLSILPIDFLHTSAFSDSDKDITLRVSLVRGVYEIGRHGSPTPCVPYEYLLFERPRLYTFFRIHADFYSAATIRSSYVVAASFLFSPPCKERRLDNEKVNGAAELRRWWWWRQRSR